MFAFPKSIKKLWCVLALSLGLVWIPSAQADFSLDFANVDGANVTFTGTGNTFTFVDAAATGYDFQITAEVGGTLIKSLFGNISGTFTIGAITTIGKIETAPVTGAGTISIDDGAGFKFSASVDWKSITTVGSGGSINTDGVFNLTSASYGGTNAELLALVSEINASAGTAVATFQFIPSKTLTQLTADGTTNSTSYSGNITTTAIPAPPSVILFLSGLPLFGGMRWMRRRRLLN